MLIRNEVVVELGEDDSFETVFDTLATLFICCLYDFKRGFIPSGADLGSYRELLKVLRSKYPDKPIKQYQKIVLVDWFKNYLDIMEMALELPDEVKDFRECVDVFAEVMAREYPGLSNGCVSPVGEKKLSEDPE